MACGVYKIVHKKSGKFYLGSSEDMAKRVKRHFRDLGKNEHHCIRLQKLFNKDPDIDGYSVKYKTKSSRKSAYRYEQKQISKNLLNKKMLNIGTGVIGGDNLTRNPRRKEIIENIRLGVQGWMDGLTKEEKKWLFGLKGEKNGMYGKTHSKKARKKIAKAAKGNQNAKGKTWSTESKKKFSENLKGKRLGKENPFYGKQHSKETKEKLSKSMLGKKPSNSKKVRIENKIYESATEASRQLGIHTTTISYRARSENPKFKEYEYL